MKINNWIWGIIFFDKHKFDPRGDAEQVWRCCPGFKFDHQHGHSHSIVKNILWTSVGVSVSANQYIYIYCNYIYIYNFYIYIYINIYKYIAILFYKRMELVESHVVSRMQWSVAGVFLGHLIPEPWLPVIVPLQSIHLTFFLFQIRWIYFNLQIDPVIVLVLANSHQIPLFFSR